MKRALSLLIASLLIGSVCFVVFCFVFGYESSTAVSISIGAVAGGLAGEWIRERLKNGKQSSVTERTSE
ncbi:MAG: hypothetical protein C4329_14355 [Chitinophagaceae bacterium]